MAVPQPPAPDSFRRVFDRVRDVVLLVLGVWVVVHEVQSGDPRGVALLAGLALTGVPWAIAIVTAWFGRSDRG